jgi:hypothetical protein
MARNPFAPFDITLSCEEYSLIALRSDGTLKNDFREKFITISGWRLCRISSSDKLSRKVPDASYYDLRL